MVRVRSVLSAKKRKKRVLKQTAGQFGHRKTRYQQAKRSLIKGLRFQYRDRKVKKREFRSLWTVRINAACREEGIMYSRFISGLKAANVTINRKMIAELAVSSPEAFKKLVEIAKANQKEVKEVVKASAN